MVGRIPRSPTRVLTLDHPLSLCRSGGSPRKGFGDVNGKWGGAPSHGTGDGPVVQRRTLFPEPRGRQTALGKQTLKGPQEPQTTGAGFCQRCK